MDRAPAASDRSSSSPDRPARESIAHRIHALVGELARPRPALYYADLLASAGAGWTGLLLAGWLLPSWWSVPLFVVAVLGLYRAASFIHELTHLRPGTVPGLDTAWNVVLGLPLLLPSSLYVGGVHSVHHAKAHYGTSRDPEYLPLTWWPAWKRWAWIAHAALLPLALVVRAVILAPASALHPRIRGAVWQHASSLTINPGFIRGPPPPELRTRFRILEALCSAWAVVLAILVFRRVVPVRYVALAVLAAAAIGVLNQLRTIVTHRFVHDGDDALSFEQQFLDSVNVPGSRILTALWAPVGLRYHALHHLLPGLPYHALGPAHRRILAAVGTEDAYHGVNEPSLAAALRGLATRSTARQPRAA